jgi:DNA-binding Lrp family transcriptional regulator
LSAETGLSISEVLRRLELLKKNGFLSLPSDAGEHPEHI